MRRLLLDANMPRGLIELLAPHDVRTAHYMGWGELTNGDLLAAAENEGFGVMLTADRNIRYQQNLAHRRIGIIELTTSHWDTVRDNIHLIKAAVVAMHDGGYAVVELPRPPRTRRVYQTPPTE